MKKGTVLGRFFEGFDEALFPSGIYCMSCGSLIDRSRSYALCDECIRKIHWITGRTCDKCGKALQDTYRGRLCYDCMIYTHYFEKGFSCFTYGLKERELLLDYKYNGKSYMGRKLGDILFDKISCEKIKIDGVVAVPIHKKRERKRGYNQSAIMAKRLAERMEVPFLPNGLQRTRDTSLLRSMNPAEREGALNGAFAVGYGAKKSLGMKKILLIDDIITTGSTADSCSKVLLDAGADRVYLLTLASGGNRKPVQCAYDSGL